MRICISDKTRLFLLVLALTFAILVDVFAFDINFLYNYAGTACMTDCGIYNGQQLSFMVNVVDGILDGMQAGLVVNWVTGDASGLQAGGMINVVAGDFSGIQVGPFFNGGDGTVSGIQCSGIVNIAVGAIDGLQLSSAYNSAGSVYGSQISGIANYSKGEMDGLQLSCLINKSAEVAGWQIGIVNISEVLNGHAFGLVNIERSGIADLGIFLDSRGTAGVEGRLGTKRTYTAVAIDADVIGRGRPSSFSLAFGRRIRMCREIIDIDLGLLQRMMLPLSTISQDEYCRIVRARIAMPLSTGLFFTGGCLGLLVYDGNYGWILETTNSLRGEVSVFTGIRLGRK